MSQVLWKAKMCLIHIAHKLNNWHTMDPCITLWSKPDITYTSLSPIAPIKTKK